MEQVLEAFREPILYALPKLPNAILTLLVGLLVLNLLQWSFERVLRLIRAPRSLTSILSSISETVLWIILMVVIFQSLGLTQVAFVFSGVLAIIGVALGTGATSMVQDVIAGLFLSRDKDFNIGYTIKIGEIEGVIRRVDVRKIRIEDKKGILHIIPTSMLDKGSWTLLSRQEDSN